MFIQIHTLTGYGASLLNRDRNGFTKTITFGETLRARVSSAALKRAWKDYDGKFALSRVAERSVRSRAIFVELIAEPLIEAGHETVRVVGTARLFQDAIAGVSSRQQAARERKTQSSEDPFEPLRRSEILCMTHPEIDYVKSEIEALLAAGGSADELKSAAEARIKTLTKNLKALGNNIAFDTAFFGRMSTGDAQSRINAPIQVADSISVHPIKRESDFFAALDDLETNIVHTGAAFTGQNEISAPLFYGYANCDIPLLASNLNGVERRQWRDTDLTSTADAIESFIRIIASVSPVGKRAAHASYAYPDLMLVEIGEEQPRQFVNAFRKACRNELGDALGALQRYIGNVVDGFGCDTLRFYVSTDPDFELDGAIRTNLTELARTLRQAILAQMGQERPETETAPATGKPASPKAAGSTSDGTKLAVATEDAEPAAPEFADPATTDAVTDAASETKTKKTRRKKAA